MNGRWTIGPASRPRRGRPWLLLRAGEWEAAQWNGPVLTLEARPLRRLGPDLLADDTDVSDVVRHVRALCEPSRLVGEALLDQRLVAGIGNMWLAECLWHARVSPWRRLGRVSDPELTAALRWARERMLATASGVREQRAVYRRPGRPCPRCGTPIAARPLGERARTAYWCPSCQRDRDS